MFVIGYKITPWPFAFTCILLVILILIVCKIFIFLRQLIDELEHQINFLYNRIERERQLFRDFVEAHNGLVRDVKDFIKIDLDEKQRIHNAVNKLIRKAKRSD